LNPISVDRNSKRVERGEHLGAEVVLVSVVLRTADALRTPRGDDVVALVDLRGSASPGFGIIPKTS